MFRQPQNAIFHCDLFLLAPLPSLLKLNSTPVTIVDSLRHRLLPAILPLTKHGCLARSSGAHRIERQAGCYSSLTAEPEDNETYNVDFVVDVLLVVT